MGGGGGGEHSFRNHTSQYQNLFSITTSDRHGADLLCNLDPHVVVTTERVCVRVGSLSALAFLHSPCTCLSALSLCTSLFALHSALTLHSTFLVYFLRTSLRRMSFEMIGFGDTRTLPVRGCAVLALFFSSLFSHRFLE